MRKLAQCITVTPSIWEIARQLTKKNHFSLSAYIEYLIKKEAGLDD